MTAGILTAVPLAALLTVVASPAAASPDYEKLCAGPVAELKALQVRIQAHNARPHTGPYTAAAAAYDAEAESLRAEQNRAISRLMACERGLDRMQARYPQAKILSPPPDAINKIAEALRKVTEAERRAVARSNPQTYDFLKYGPGKRGMTRRVDSKQPPWISPSVKGLYSAIDAKRPDFPPTAYLQGVQAPRAGTPDSAYPRSSGRTIQSVHMDHIVPLRRLVTFRDFLKLTPGNMYIVAHSPANAQWLSKKANLSKGSGSAAFVSGADAAWIRQQAQLRERTERELQELIDALLKSQRS